MPIQRGLQFTIVPALAHPLRLGSGNGIMVMDLIRDDVFASEPMRVIRTSSNYRIQTPANLYVLGFSVRFFVCALGVFLTTLNTSRHQSSCRPAHPAPSQSARRAALAHTRKLLRTTRSPRPRNESAKTYNSMKTSPARK